MRDTAEPSTRATAAGRLRFVPSARLDDLDDPEVSTSAHDRPTNPPPHDHPTHPPPPTYEMLRDSTLMRAAAVVSLEDDLALDGDVALDPEAAALDASVVRLVLSSHEREMLSLTEEQVAVLEVIDGTRTVAAVCARSGLAADRARAVLDGLVRRGIVRLWRAA